MRLDLLLHHLRRKRLFRFTRRHKRPQPHVVAIRVDETVFAIVNHDELPRHLFQGIVAIRIDLLRAENHVRLVQLEIAQHLLRQRVRVQDRDPNPHRVRAQHKQNAFATVRQQKRDLVARVQAAHQERSRRRERSVHDVQLRIDAPAFLERRFGQVSFVYLRKRRQHAQRKDFRVQDFLRNSFEMRSVDRRIASLLHRSLLRNQ